ncbi:agenet domain-containing protein [Azospirillum sp. TSO35-2]|uniref:agenet domain-containing protein n=1 Tax=Azospirillum sp. TSO35-2 TaxID=716796 RepID=UPI000D605FE4|nr:agenet domain-containing protein [Azospirillum sp. TSO35-2]PWC33856.1 hypothetical protein TSO352_26155 [Azospirillum sp. TSO35-2]
MSRLLILCFAVLSLLSACGPVYETQYSLTPPTSAEGRLCVSQCQQTRNFCRQNCGMSQQACVNDARSRALYEYQAYVNRQTAEKKPIKKSVSDFDHSSYSCGTNSCESRCEADYRDCFGGSCGGRVTSKRVCTAFCDQEKPAPVPMMAPGAVPMTAAPMAPSSGGAYGAGDSLCQPGMRVEVQSEGEWYPATVKGKRRTDGRCPVHYDDYGAEDDETVSLNRIRPL